MPNLGGWELIVLLGVVVLLFGAKRLPDMARSIGQSARVFKGEMKGMKNDTEPSQTPGADDRRPGNALPGAEHGGVGEGTQAERSAVPQPAAPVSGSEGVR